MRSNPFDEMMKGYEEALSGADADLDEFSRGVEPFDSQKLSPDDALFLYDNPMGFFPEEPLTNEEAAQRLLAEKGAVWYVKWVDDMEKLRMQQMAADGVRSTPRSDSGLLPPAGQV